MSTPTNANESYCTFTLAGDITAGGLPSEADIRKDLEDNDPKVSWSRRVIVLGFYRIFYLKDASRREKNT